MNKLLFTLALVYITGCSNTQNINQDDTPRSQNQYVGHIIGYNKYVTSSLVTDTLKNPNYNQLEVDPCWVFNPVDYCKKMAKNEFKFFTSRLTKDYPAVLLIHCGWNIIPINNDITDHIENMPIASTRFSFKTTKYTSVDSFFITIDTILPDKSIILFIDNEKHLIKNKDSLTVVDTLQGRNNETYCYRQLIVTQKVYNFGIDTLPDTSYLPYFMH